MLKMAVVQQTTMHYTVPMSVALSIRIDEAKRDQLDEIAGALDRNRNWVVNQAIQNYLELHRWQMEEIDKGIAELERGERYSLKEVRARFRKKQQRGKG